METYLKRLYAQKKAGTSQKAYPFWDYRSRRGSISASNSSHDGSSISSLSSSRSEAESENASLSGSDSDSIFLHDPGRLTLTLLADTHEVFPLLQLYQPILDWIDPDLHLFKVTERTEPWRRDEPGDSKGDNPPSVAVVLFLHEEGLVGCERIQAARRHFQTSPWRFHHSESVAGTALHAYPYNSQDFYYTSDDLPLWAVRQVHYGKEHIRVVIFASHENWAAMLDFYRLVTGTEPDLLREDFCLFTAHAQIQYDVQLALKRLPPEVTPTPPESVRLQFRVTDVGHIVPLFPNVCQPKGDNLWHTTDHDGNAVVLEVVGGGSGMTSHMDKTAHTVGKSRPQPAQVGFYV